MILLPEIDQTQGVKAAERIRDKVSEEKFGGDGKAVKVTISVGSASYPENGEDPEAIIRNADAALYEAKELGRNRIIVAGGSKKTKQKTKKKTKKKTKRATKTQRAPTKV